MNAPIKVLIVDDSLVFRHAIADALSIDPAVKVIGSVRNGKLALDSIRDNRPDLVTLDLEMPEMDGIETLKAIQQENRSNPDLPEIAVIMISSFTKKGSDQTVEALELGAFDFITKPATDNEIEGIETLRRLLSPRISHFQSLRALGKKNFSTKKSEPTVVVTTEPVADTGQPRETIAVHSVSLIAIGVSTGGPKALSDMLPELCRVTDLPIVVVQHMPEKFTLSLAESLDKICSHRVTEAIHNEPVEHRHIYIAPGGRHMILKRFNGQTRVAITDTSPENGCRPSVDVLFRSVAELFDHDAIAIILTGMGNDGSITAPQLKNNGIPLIVQDEPTAVVWGMPGSAVATGAVTAVVPLMEIPAKIAAVIAHRSSNKTV